MPELKMNDKVLYVANDSNQTTQRHLPIPKNTIGHVYWISPDKKHVAVSWSHRHDDNSVHQMNSADLLPVGKETGGHGLPFSAKKEGKMDQNEEDVDVKAKNVHIDLEPHEHEDTYEGFSKEPEGQVDEFLASPHSNIGEGTSSPWDVLAEDFIPEAGDDDLGGKKDDEDDADFMNRLNQRLGLGKTDKEKPYHYLKGPWQPGKDKGDAGPDSSRKVYGTIPKGGMEPENPTDPKNLGGKSRYRAQDAGGKLPIDFQDYDTPVHPHLQKARGELKHGLDWILKQVRQAVPNLDQFKPGNKPKAQAAAAQQAKGVPDVMPGPGGHMYPTFSGKKDDDDKAKPAPGERNPATGQPLAKPRGGNEPKSPTDFAKISRLDPSNRAGLVNIPGGPQTKAAVGRAHAAKGGHSFSSKETGTGGYWELARLAQELEQIPDMPSDKAMPRLQSVTNDLYKLKASLKKNPNKDPDLEKAAKGVETALAGIPGLMKAAGALAKSTGTDKDLWKKVTSTKMAGHEEDPDAVSARGDAGGYSPETQRYLDRINQIRAPKKMVVHPTGADPKREPTKAEREREAERQKQAAASQRAQPTVRKPGEGEAEKGPVKPTIPASAYARAQPQVRKAGDKKDEPEKKEPEKKDEPKKDDDSKKQPAWMRGRSTVPNIEKKPQLKKDEPKKDDEKKADSDKGPEWTKAYNKPEDKKDDDKKEPEKKDDDKKESTWLQLSRLVG